MQKFFENKIVKNTAVLTAITLASGLLLGLVYEVTKEPISRSKEAAKQEAYQQVMPEAEAFEAYEAFDGKEAEKVIAESGIAGCYVSETVTAKNEKEETVGYVVTAVSKEGYGGEIEVSVGIASDGTVTGTEILSINETAGLGMKADEPAFKEQFADVKTEEFVIKKDDPAGHVDALSGATITTRAVTDAVNAGLSYYHSIAGGGENE